MPKRRKAHKVTRSQIRAVKRKLTSIGVRYDKDASYDEWAQMIRHGRNPHGLLR